MVKDFFIVGGIDDSTTELVTSGILEATEELADYKEGVIRLFIDSPGGFVSSLMGLLYALDLAKRRGIIVETHVLGDACSAASILAASGTKGHRYISEFGTHLVHWGRVPWASKTPEESERGAEYMDRHFGVVESLYRRYADIPKLKKKLRSDRWIVYATEAVEYGLADHVMDMD